MAHTHSLSTWLFLRLLGAVFLIAFISLWTQVHGLVGAQGILPAESFVTAVRDQLGVPGFFRFPTVLLLGAGDGALHVVCGAGVALSLALIAGVAPGPCLLALWALYLSLSTVGREFLSFQWDGLLMETALVAAVTAPWRGWRPPGLAIEPDRVARIVLLWLLFRLMFMSGVVKLWSGDEAWWSLRALEHHFETQPLPTWLAWHAHRLPPWALRVACAGMFVVELGVPWLILVPRARARRVTFAAFVAFQVGIALTGNYGFFNLLTIVLCVPLLDDAALRRILPAQLVLRLDGAPGPPRPPAPASRIARRGAAGALASLAALVVVAQLMGYRSLPGPVLSILGPVQAFNVVSPYGLFSIMTTDRPEIVIEGSRDGREWRAYEHPWKPGDPRRRPRFNAPHQPRLDWQLWFAALGDFRRNQWVGAVLVRLLEGSPDVIALFEHDPFPGEPPRYVRAMVYDYRLTDAAERRRTGAWWKREEQGLYFPALRRE